MADLTCATALLVAAIRERYPSNTGSDESQLVGAIAEATVVRGLVAAPVGFVLQPTSLGHIGSHIRSTKCRTQYASWRVKQLVRDIRLCTGCFSLRPKTAQNVQTLVVHLQAIIPDASQQIRTLLPTVPWPDQTPTAAQTSDMSAPSSTGPSVRNNAAGPSSAYSARSALHNFNPEHPGLISLMEDGFDQSSWELLQYQAAHNPHLERDLQTLSSTYGTLQELHGATTDTSVDGGIRPHEADEDAASEGDSLATPASSLQGCSPVSPASQPASPTSSQVACKGRLFTNLIGRLLGHQASATSSSTAAEAEFPHTAQAHTDSQSYLEIPHHDPVQSILQLLPCQLSLQIQQRLEHHKHNRSARPYLVCLSESTNSKIKFAYMIWHHL